MSLAKYAILCGLLGCCAVKSAFGGEPFHAGPLFDTFPLTLDPGHRTEFFGPLFYSEQKDSQFQWGVPPLAMSYTHDPSVEYSEFDFLYPVLTWDRYGQEYRWTLLQLWSFAGGQAAAGTGDENRRFTLFPIYFQQRAADPTNNYTALVPFYGHLQNRLYRDEIDFVMLPLYVRTRKRDIVTWNMPYPFFHLREGDGLRGWQLWPLLGHEEKDPTVRTNGFGDTEVISGHDYRMVLWPFFLNNHDGLGTENPVKQQGLLPFYSFYRSPLRDSTTIPWPLGVTHTVDREKGYVEWDAPWPLVEFASGEGKTTSRIFPLFNKSHNQFLEDDWYLWPVYKYNRLTAPPAYRERTRILFFLYSSMNQTNTETGHAEHRTDFFPFFSHWREFDGSERWQVLSILEPFFPNSKSIARDYGPLYSFWRWQHNPTTGATSQSLLWNLYRRETAPSEKKISLLFGLFQYQSSPDGARWRVFYVPFGGGKPAAPEPPSRN
jgi:hypothetical protein